MEIDEERKTAQRRTGGRSIYVYMCVYFDAKVLVHPHPSHLMRFSSDATFKNAFVYSSIHPTPSSPTPIPRTLHVAQS